MAAMGWKTYFGAKKESTYGTYVAPTEFGEIETEGIVYNPNRKTVRTLNSARAATKSVLGRVTVAGPVTFPIVPDDLIGLFLKDLLTTETYNAFGGGDAGAYSHGFVPAGTVGLLGISCEIGRDNTDLATNVWKYMGGHVRKIRISGKADDYLKATVDLAFADGAAGATAQAPSYSARSPLMFHTGTMTLDSAAYNFTEFDLDIDPGQKDRIAGASRLKLQDTPGPLKVSGSFGGFVQTAAIAAVGGSPGAQDIIGKFMNGTAAAISILCQGPAVIGSTSKYPQLQIDMSTVYFDGEQPTAKSPEEIMQKASFESLNGTLASLLTVTIQNARSGAY